MATKQLLAHAPVARVEKDAFDHAGIDVARPEVFEGRHRVTGHLHRYAAFDDVTLAQVHPRIDWGGNREIACGLESGLIHRDSSARSLW
jgi:carbamoylphosphate synthase small subunit